MKLAALLAVAASLVSVGCTTGSGNGQRYLPMDTAGAGVMVLDSYTGRVLIGVPREGWKEQVPPITSENVHPLP